MMSALEVIMSAATSGLSVVPQTRTQVLLMHTRAHTNHTWTRWRPARSGTWTAHAGLDGSVTACTDSVLYWRADPHAASSPVKALSTVLASNIVSYTITTGQPYRPAAWFMDYRSF